MEDPVSFIDFFQALVSGTGVLLGFALASQITILTHVLTLSEAELSSTLNKQKILIFFTWFFTIINIVLIFCLVIFQSATTEKPYVDVRIELFPYARFAYYAYMYILPGLIIISQFKCSYVITKMLRRRAKE